MQTGTPAESRSIQTQNRGSPYHGCPGAGTIARITGTAIRAGGARGSIGPRVRHAQERQTSAAAITARSRRAAPSR
jgi:hypothetical protein